MLQKMAARLHLPHHRGVANSLQQFLYACSHCFFSAVSI